MRDLRFCSSIDKVEGFYAEIASQAHLCDRFILSKIALGSGTSIVRRGVLVRPTGPVPNRGSQLAVPVPVPCGGG
jgi:hypothetical protein